MTDVTAKSSSTGLITAIVVVLLIVGGYYFLTQPDTRSTSQKVGDAVHDLDQGPDKAARQLESRTPGQKLGDAIKDNTSSNGSGN